MAIKLIKDFINTGNVDYVTPSATYHFDKEAVKVSHQSLIPGHAYTFRVLKPIGSDSVPTLDDYQALGRKGTKPYYDNRPIFISLGKAGPLEMGLNLKLMPRQIRKKFLRFYLSRFLPTLDSLTNEDGQFHDIDKRIRMSELRPFLMINSAFVQGLSGFSNVNFEFLVDKYNREEMVNLAIIDWPDLIKLSNADYSQDPTIATRTPISYFLTKYT